MSDRGQHSIRESVPGNGNVQQILEALQRLRHASDLSFRQDGHALVAAVLPAAIEIGKSIEGRIWELTLEGEATQLTHGPGCDGMPRCSPVDGRLAFVSDRLMPGRMSLFLLDQDGSSTPLANVPGSVEQAIWTPDATALFVLAADRGLDSSACDGAVRLWWDEKPDPERMRPNAAWRRLFRVSASDGLTTEVGPDRRTVWDFDLIDEQRAVALVSADSSERGWHRANLVLLNLQGRSEQFIYRSRWQMQGPTVDPSGRRVAFVEGWASDRGLVAGGIRVVDLDSGETYLVAEEILTDISFVRWHGQTNLLFAGWTEFGTTYGVVNLDTGVEWQECEDAVVSDSRFLAKVLPAPDGSGLAAVREADHQAPEIVFRASREAPWRQLSTFNDRVVAGLELSLDIREVEWRGHDDLPIRGLLLLPPARTADPSTLIVSVHGGPTLSVKHAFDPGQVLPLAAAGYAVLLPNYRGSIGRGMEFTQANLGDPGGAEFQDILCGVDWCADQGIANVERVGITGVSYGGYMTAWAVATSDRFRAAVMISGISNLLSCHYTCNHAFCEFIVGGAHTEPEAQRLMVDRSPLIHVATASTPTLILHGTEDRCTPLGQAEEFYRALADQGVETELVTYPREGHGFQERAHQVDAWQRSVAWFDRHLKGRE